MVRNPPYFAFSMHSAPGEYRGFFWFYFINEHLLRFLNRRYPRDYNTVPPLWFWLLNLVWIFPWSVYLLGRSKLSLRVGFRAERTRLMALCWIGVVMLFFTFSTTQEYYSMPIYPALALLVGSALGEGSRRLRCGHGSPSRDFFTAVRSARGLACDGLAIPCYGQHLCSADPTPRTLHTLNGAHSGSDA